MTPLKISLPDDREALIEQLIATGHYGTASDYISHLIRQEPEQSAKRWGMS